jgi:hypothetical protein
MKLQLYNSLKTALLGSFAPVSERFEAAYQAAVERYAPEAESGLKKWARDAIQGWLGRYNKLMPTAPKRLRYYQILALYFTETVLRGVREGDKAFAGRNMLAYWMATGSGKTLLMHLNILQYLDHIGGFGAFDELQVILTTPGVNLIEQHRRELGPLVDALNTLCANRIKLTVESTQALLNRERGFFNLPPSKRVFRLVLVDEGHIGLSSGGQETGRFKDLRHRLADYPNAFLFEYSATYHGIADKHVEEYEDQIVYDYNYYRFFKDGYGKDYDIQKIGADAIAKDAECWDNFGAAFDALADKLRIHETLRVTAGKGGLPFTAGFADRPLIAFMGNTVEDSKKEGGAGDEVSDIRKLLAFLVKLTPKQKERLAPVFNGMPAGLLTLTRSPAVTDEIWLSFGEGEYWGIINVGNGDKFFRDSEGHADLKDSHGQPLVQLRKRPILEERYRFDAIDRPASPINVLIGSRKFAEGWNCYRVSVIGLINLGSGKGNKIIQIFGRGVRLQGLHHDGKRQFREHCDDYTALTADTDEDRLRRLETLNVFSLKDTYLKKFLDALSEELPRFVVERRVPVKPQVLALGKSKKETFGEYRSKLHIFKIGRNDSEPRLIVTHGARGDWCWNYLRQDGSDEAGTVPTWPIILDYRPDSEQPGRDLAVDLHGLLREYAAFAPLPRLGEQLAEALRARQMQLLWEEEDKRIRQATPADLIGALSSVLYHRPFATLSPSIRENLLLQVLRDLITKLHHKLIYDINTRRYRFNEPLAQVEPGKPGDFIRHYDVRIEFKSGQEKAEFEKNYPAPNIPEQLELDVQESRHLYRPLLRDSTDNASAKLKFNAIAISPDALNPGERKFTEDLHAYLSSPSNRTRFAKYDFYLMRNVESLRSVGVYLDSETRAYFPDFVLWVTGDTETHVLLVDPKGQSGIQDWNSLTSGINAKVLLAKSGHLAELAKNLRSVHGRPFKVNSFILLRDKSPLGKLPTMLTLTNRETIMEMERHHVLRLDWSDKKEDGSSSNVPDGRCYVERMFGLAGLS